MVGKRGAGGGVGTLWVGRLGKRGGEGENGEHKGAEGMGGGGEEKKQGGG